MKKALVFLVEGFEEIEALATVDILRRGGVLVTTVSMTGFTSVTGAHGVKVIADDVFDNVGVSFVGDGFDMLILPGGSGTPNYFKYEALESMLKAHNDKGGLISAICAAPTYLAKIGLLEGKKAVCFPGMEEGLLGALSGEGNVVQDGNIITSKCPVTAVNFGLYLLKTLMGEEVYKKVYDEMHFEIMAKPE